jgi:hypothetical protein
MSHLIVTLDVDREPWADLQDLGLEHGQVERVGRLTAGMQSGKSSVAVVIRLDNGNAVIGEVSMDHFLAAAGAMNARERLEGLRS